MVTSHGVTQKIERIVLRPYGRAFSEGGSLETLWGKRAPCSFSNTREAGAHARVASGAGLGAFDDHAQVPEFWAQFVVVPVA